MAFDLASKIHAVPDFPKPGILFRDITPLLSDPVAYRALVDTFTSRYAGQRIAKVVAIESRGYLIGAPLALAIGAGLVLVRKPGKLPRAVDSESYALEYGTDVLEIHAADISPGERVLIVDDLLATGGTAAAAGSLVKRRGAETVEFAFIIELDALKGRNRLTPAPVFSVLNF